jgi:hypothetical protein
LPARREPRGVGTDVVLQPAAAAEFPRRAPNGRWFDHARTASGESHLRWGRQFEFLVSADGRTIRYRALEGSSPESLSAYLVGQALSFSLIARGVDPLHGTAVAVDGGAAVFLGSCGTGKSTLGAALLGRGFPLVTDDVVALEHRAAGYAVHPGPARVKLFPRVARLLARGRSGVPMVKGTAKLIFPLAEQESAGRPVPLRAFYVLDSGRRRDVRITTLRAGEACVELLRAAFNLHVTDRRRLANQFRFVTRLAAEVPVRRLSYTRSLTALPNVLDAVLGDLASRPS